MSNANVTIEIIDTLFIKLAGIFPAFLQAWGGQEQLNNAKKMWLLAFIENDIDSTEKIKRGLKKAMAQKTAFVPSIGQFIKWCESTPEDLKLPALETAFSEAMRNAYLYNKNPTWQHPVVYLAFQLTGRDKLNSNDKDVAWEAFEKNYIEACKKYAQGEILPAPPPQKQLTSDRQDDTPHSTKVARQYLDSFYEKLSVQQNDRFDREKQAQEQQEAEVIVPDYDMPENIDYHYFDLNGLKTALKQFEKTELRIMQNLKKTPLSPELYDLQYVRMHIASILTLIKQKTSFTVDT